MAADATKNSLIGRRVFLGTLSSSAGQAIALVTGFLLTPFILNQLGEASYGLWALVSAVVGYGSLLDVGIGNAVVKYVAEYRAKAQAEQASSVVATSLALYSVLGLLALLLSALVAPIFPYLFNIPPADRATASWLVLLSGSVLAISIPCATATAVLHGLQRYDIVSLINVVASLGGAAAVVLVLLNGGGVLGLVIAHLPIIALTQTLNLWAIKRIAPELKFGWRGASRTHAHMIVGFSAWLFMQDIAGRLKTETDRLVIAAFMPVRAVAPYAIAFRLSELPQLLTTQFVKVLMPLASELHAENDQARLRDLYIVSSRLTLAIFVPAGCVVVVLARALLAGWIGPSYAMYAHLVIILTFASLLEMSMWPAGSVFQGTGRVRLLAPASVAAALANLVLSIILAPRLGLTGVALGTLIPSACECLVILPYASRVLGVGSREVLRSILLPALLPALPMTLTLYLLNYLFSPSSLLMLTPIALLGALVYGLGYWSFGASHTERAAYRNVANGLLRSASAALGRS